MSLLLIDYGGFASSLPELARYDLCTHIKQAVTAEGVPLGDQCSIASNIRRLQVYLAISPESKWHKYVYKL
jgi:hypothetical protein